MHNPKLCKTTFVEVSNKGLLSSLISHIVSLCLPPPAVYFLLICNLRDWSCICDGRESGVREEDCSGQRQGSGSDWRQWPGKEGVCERRAAGFHHHHHYYHHHHHRHHTHAHTHTYNEAFGSISCFTPSWFVHTRHFYSFVWIISYQSLGLQFVMLWFYYSIHRIITSSSEAAKQLLCVALVHHQS